MTYFQNDLSVISQTIIIILLNQHLGFSKNESKFCSTFFSFFGLVCFDLGLFLGRIFFWNYLCFA